jgi:hypothetical protein
MAGMKIQSLEYQGAPMDLYIASERNWATLLPVRTGYREYSIKLCTPARILP